MPPITHRCTKVNKISRLYAYYLINTSPPINLLSYYLINPPTAFNNCGKL